MAAVQLPEPPDRALVGIFNTADPGCPPIVFGRDDSSPNRQPAADVTWFNDLGEYTWAELLVSAAEMGGEVLRLHRADDPAVTDAFNAGVEAAAKAIEAHADSIDWHEGGGVWADAIEKTREATR